MSREIETDGFITRADDLKGSEPKYDFSKSVWENIQAGNGITRECVDWDAQKVQIDKLIPPPFGSVIITENGLVLMCKGTYKMLTEGKEYAEVELNGIHQV